MEQKKIVIGAIGLIVVLGAVWFLFFSQPSFESEYARMSDAWQEKGIECEQLHNCSALFDADTATLGEVKEELTVFSRSSSGASKELALAYILLVDNAIESASITESRQKLLSPKYSVCEKVRFIEKATLQLESFKENTNTHLISLSDFKEKYPVESEAVAINEISEPVELDSEEMDKLIELTVLLGGECE